MNFQLSLSRVFFPFSLLLLLASCTKDKGTPDYAGYPDEVGKIIMTKCATAGCHNDISKNAAAGLSLEGWDKLFEGGRNSAAVVPFSHEYSTLFLYTNTYSDLGQSLLPTMPYGKAPLSKEEVQILKDWIDAGAPDRNGFVKYSDNPYRKKIYVANQGCDVVTVIDNESLMPMRYISVGKLTSSIDAPHMIKVSPDGNYWYTTFIAHTSGTSLIQKFRTSDDSHVGDITIPAGSWNTFTFTPDSKKAFIVDWSANGKIAYVNLETMALIDTWQGSGLYLEPHGSAMGPNGDSLYVTAQNGNCIYKISPLDPISPRLVSMDPSAAADPGSATLKIHELAFSPDGSKYIVTCQGTDDIRIVQTSNDSVLAIIPVPASSLPSEIAFSESSNYVFVTCAEDVTTFPGKRGSVAIIDYTINSLVKFVNPGFQPHGIAVHESEGIVAVANRNVTTSGPAPHHSNSCGGRNGYITYISLSTLEMAPGKQLEVSVDPYSIAVRK
jgi:DNA-binding beta-propeller fold protein YncE